MKKKRFGIVLIVVCLLFASCKPIEPVHTIASVPPPASSIGICLREGEVQLASMLEGVLRKRGWSVSVFQAHEVPEHTDIKVLVTDEQLYENTPELKTLVEEDAVFRLNTGNKNVAFATIQNWALAGKELAQLLSDDLLLREQPSCNVIMAGLDTKGHPVAVAFYDTVRQNISSSISPNIISYSEEAFGEIIETAAKEGRPQCIFALDTVTAEHIAGLIQKYGAEDMVGVLCYGITQDLETYMRMGAVTGCLVMDEPLICEEAATLIEEYLNDGTRGRREVDLTLVSRDNLDQDVIQNRLQSIYGAR